MSELLTTQHKRLIRGTIETVSANARQFEAWGKTFAAARMREAIAQREQTLADDLERRRALGGSPTD